MDEYYDKSLNISLDTIKWYVIFNDIGIGDLFGDEVAIAHVTDNFPADKILSEDDMVASLQEKGWLIYPSHRDMLDSL